MQSQTSQTHGQAQEVDAIEAASTMLLSSLDAEMTIEGEEDSKQASPVLAIVLVLGGLGLLLGGGYMLRGQIQAGPGVRDSGVLGTSRWSGSREIMK